MTAPEFKRDLAYGWSVEGRLLEAMPKGWAPSTDRRWDLVHTDGRTCEVKGERRGWDETDNVFFELTVDGKPGGPWRAHEDGVDLYVHVFLEPKPMALIWKNVPALVEWLDAWVATTRPWAHHIKNKGFCGRGYAVPYRAMTGDAKPRRRWL